MGCLQKLPSFFQYFMQVSMKCMGSETEEFLGEFSGIWNIKNCDFEFRRKMWSRCMIQKGKFRIQKSDLYKKNRLSGSLKIIFGI